MGTAQDRQDIWDRFAPLAGLAFVVAFIASAVFYFAGGSPDHDTPASVVSHLRANRASLEASWTLELIGQFALIVYIAGFVTVLARRIGAWGAGLIVVLSAGMISIAISLVCDGAAVVALVYAANKTSAGVTYALYTFGNGAGTVLGGIAVGVTVLAAGSLILSSGAMARWMGWLGVASGVLFAVGDALQNAAGPLGGVGNIAGTVGGILSIVFVAATSIAMMSRSSTAVSRAPATATS